MLQSGEFLRLEWPRLARREIELKRTITNAANFFDVVSDLFEHFSDLPIASFVQRDLQPGIVGFFDHANPCRRGAHPLVRIALFGNRYARAQAPELVFRRHSRNLHEISFGNVRGRLHQFVRECTVIGEQQQALAVEIETSDGIQTDLAANQVHHRGPTFGIGDGGYVSSRLVEGDVLVALGALKQLSIHADRVCFGIGLGAELSNNVPVYAHQSGLDEFFGFAARGNTCRSHDLL